MGRYKYKNTGNMLGHNQTTAQLRMASLTSGQHSHTHSVLHLGEGSKMELCENDYRKFNSFHENKCILHN